MPSRGQCSSAATSVSCASSSATPTSRTMRATVPMIFADSMRHTAAIARSAAVKPIRSALRVLGGEPAEALLLLAQLGRERLAEVVGLEHPADLDHGFALERIRAALHPLDRLFLRRAAEHPEAGDQLLRLGERAVDDRASA